MLELNANLIAKKNAVADAGAWVWLIQARYATGLYLRFAANQNADVVWNGNTWQWMPIEIGTMRQEKGAVPTMTLRVLNANKMLQAYMEQYNGLVDQPVTFYGVHSGHLTVTTNLPTFAFTVVGASVNGLWAQFSLSVLPNPFNQPDPKDKMLKNFCRFGFPHSVDARCPYTAGTYTECDKTLSDCRTRNAAAASRFGGFPAIGLNRIYV